MQWIETSPRGLRLHVRVTPRASKDEVRGLHGDALKIKLRAPPVDGKANKALIDFLSETLDVSPSSIAIVSGETGRSKSVLIAGLDESVARERLGMPV